jgi:hypothetical protein
LRFLILAILLVDSAEATKEADRHEDDTPRRRESEDTAQGALIFGGTLSYTGAELRAEGADAVVSALKTYLSDGMAGSQQAFAVVDSQAGEKIVRSLAKSRRKETMEVEGREARFVGSFTQRESKLVVAGQQIARATQATEGVIVQQARLDDARHGLTW